MNIPPEVARAQGHHGVKGAVHGIKGGRPRLALTDEERVQRRRDRQVAYRRRKGIMPRKVLTREERVELDRQQREARFNEEYLGVWGKLPHQTLSPEEFQKHYPRFRKWVRDCRARNFPLHWPVDFVRNHCRDIKRKEREEEMNHLQLEERRAHIRQYEARQRWIASCTPQPPSPSVGRNQPCPCGSGLKFKKCCG
jgi:hypothetical protein